MQQQRKMPPWIAAATAGVIVFALLSNFVNLTHVADELVMVGGMFGILVYLSGSIDVANDRLEGGSGW